MRFQLFLLAAAAAIVALATPAVAKLYGNPRFGYFADIPSQFSIADPEPANNDGRAFHTADHSAELLVYGGWILDDFVTETHDRKDGDRQDGWAIGYESKEGAANAVWSGKKGDRIFYEHMITSCKGKAHANFRLEYPAADASKYDAAIKTLNASLKAGVGCAD